MPDDDFTDDDFDLSAAGDAVLARLQRPAWPTESLAFTGKPIEPSNIVQGCSIRQTLACGLVAAQRFTCALSRERFERFLAVEPPHRTLVIHALDAAPSIPLLLHWAVANVELLAALRVRARAELQCAVMVAMPDDIPTAIRRALATVGEVRWISHRYPAGAWRLMPHVLGMAVNSTLTLDAIAAVDLTVACRDAAAPIERPIALEANAVQPRLLRARRGQTLAEVANADVPWSVGAPLAATRVDSHYVLGDDELCFYRDDVPAESVAALPCVRCGACVTICPTRCDPVALLHVAAAPSHRAAVRAGLDACIQCGLCTAACPSAIPLHQTIASLQRGFASREAT